MTQKQKGYVGLGVMAVLSAGVIVCSEPLYQAIHSAVVENISYTPGTYVGSAEGFGGDVIATVTVSDSAILSVELKGEGETPEIGGAALEQLAPAFVQSGTAMVDAVSGSTITSTAAMKAVGQALDQASGKIPVIDASALETEAAAEPAESEAAAEELVDEVYEGGLRTGMAVVHSMKKSKDAGESDGTAEVDAVVAAVVIDHEGRILSCKLDIAQSMMNFTAEGKVVMKEEFHTKKELGDSYGMKAASGIGKEWYEQAEAFENYVIGKTAKEVAGIAVGENGKTTDADLSAGVTVAIGDYQKAVVEAVKNAAEIGTQEGDQLGLGIVTNMHKSKDATADADGQCQAYSTFVAVTANAEGVITGSIIDASQGTVTFDASGVITSDLAADVKTKKQLGESYGMKKASGIGKEWYEQADAFSDYIAGKTADEVTQIAVGEDGKATDADLTAGVTVGISDFQAAVAKAAADAEQSGEISAYTYEGGLRTGMAVVHSMKKSKDAGESDGTAEVDAVAAAVIIDHEGRIVSCKLDIAQSMMNFTAEGKVVMKEEFQTKKELGDSYGMKAASGIGKEWYEQAEAFENYVIGKTAKEVAGIAVGENGKTTDADLSAGVTVAIGDYQKAVVEAVKNAAEIGTQEGDQLGLGIVTNMHKSKDATADADGQCQAYSTFVAVTANAEGVITGSIIDASQGTVTFDASGVITSDLAADVKTKKQLGESYGMKKASGIGKEWYEQADAFSDYIAGKTADEVTQIAVGEDGKATDADLTAGVTVGISDFQAAVAKAAADAE
ncbi:MAG: FMN-binding protein [Lachnospiraceae bacterium]|nr:FMN-binding protein [Lachnospiraceae bacterium]